MYLCSQQYTLLGQQYASLGQQYSLLGQQYTQLGQVDAQQHRNKLSTQYTAKVTAWCLVFWLFSKWFGMA